MNYDNTKPSTQNNPPKEGEKKDVKGEMNPDGDQKQDPSKPGMNQPEQKKM